MVGWRRSGAELVLLLLLAGCSPSGSETDASSGSEDAATVAIDAADGADGADGAGTAGTGGSGGGGDEGPGRPPSPLYIEPIQALGAPPTQFVNNMESNCEAAKAGPTCLTLTFEPAENAADESCSVERTDPVTHLDPIAVGTRVTVHLECLDPPEEENPDTSTSEPESDEE